VSLAIESGQISGTRNWILIVQNVKMSIRHMIEEIIDELSTS